MDWWHQTLYRTLDSYMYPYWQMKTEEASIAGFWSQASAIRKNQSSPVEVLQSRIKTDWLIDGIKQFQQFTRKYPSSTWSSLMSAFFCCAFIDVPSFSAFMRRFLTSSKVWGFEWRTSLLRLCCSASYANSHAPGSAWHNKEQTDRIKYISS